MTIAALPRLSARSIAGLVVAAVALSIAMALAGPAVAKADWEIRSNMWNESPYGGATTYTSLYRRASDGAVYTSILLQDNKVDGRCANVQLRWYYRSSSGYNTETYQVCGAGETRLIWGQVWNPTRYTHVDDLTYETATGWTSWRNDLLLSNFTSSGSAWW